MEKCELIFGVALGRIILGYTNSVRKSHQVMTLSATQGQKKAKPTIKTL